MNDELESLNATDWKYKAEGNKHIVVCNGKGNVLRLLKSTTEPLKKGLTEISLNTSVSCTNTSILKENNTDGNENELQFIEHVVLPLMNNCDACRIPKQIRISKSFYQELGHIIASERPTFRKHKSLDATAPGLLMHDHCFIPKTNYYKHLLKKGLKFHPDVMTVEIKMKKGHVYTETSLSNVDTAISEYKVCQFCRTQMHRTLQEKRYNRCSFYCPLDLFSGVPERMGLALKELFYTPQNNFRIFKNGKLVFSQEIIDSANSNEENFSIDLLQSLLSSVFSSTINCIYDSTALFIDLLCKAMLLPVLEKTNLEPVTSQHCHGSYFKQHVCKQTPNHTPQSVIGNVAKLDRLPATCILGIIHSLQLLETDSLLDVKLCYDSVTSHLQLKSEMSDNLRLDAPYTSIEWCNLVNCILKDKKDISFGDDWEKATHMLRQFLVAKSFNDCSIMVSMQKIEHLSLKAQQYIAAQKSSPPTAHLHILQDFEGSYYFVSIAVVDVDPKPSNKIPEYYQQHTSIMKWWDNILAHTAPMKIR